MILPTSQEFWASPYGRDALRTIQMKAKQYWSVGIYRYYHKDSGRLGQACLVRLQGTSVVVGMPPLREGGVDYGKLQRRGFPPSPGEYNPKTGTRMKAGTHPGVSRDKFWRPWMRDFSKTMRQIVKSEVRPAFKQFVRDRLGVAR